MPVHARCLYTVGISADVLTCYTRVKDLLLRTRLRNKTAYPFLGSQIGFRSKISDEIAPIVLFLGVVSVTN